MTHRYDGSSIDIEKQLVRYMVRHRISRRVLLERIAKSVRRSALAPVIAACTGSAASPSPGPRRPRPRRARRRRPSQARPRRRRCPAPRPSSTSTTGLDYIGEGVIEGFEEKYGIKVNYDLFDDIYAAYAGPRRRRRRVRRLVPDRRRSAGLHRSGRRAAARPSLIPNLVNLGTEWADPGYDPGNAHSVPYVWWTTGVGYDTTKITEPPTSSNALWDPRWSGHISMMDDYAEMFGLTLIQLGYSANTANTAELDEALARLQEQKPLVRTYTNDTVTTMAAATSGSG